MITVRLSKRLAMDTFFLLEQKAALFKAGKLQSPNNVEHVGSKLQSDWRSPRLQLIELPPQW